MIAWVFPGQGSQTVGMAAGLGGAPAREVFTVAREVLGWDVRALCMEGPDEVLAATERAQPAILTVSVAAARALEASGLLPDAVAGHSVGEFAALVTARALGFEDALRVVEARGHAMARAGEAAAGGMAAIIGLERGVLDTICSEVFGIVGIANVNAPGQIVISGEQKAVASAGDAARAAGGRVIPLAVSVAAHSPLMAPAAAEVAAALEEVQLMAPIMPYASSYAGTVLGDPDEIARALVDAVTGPVNWPACIASLEGDTFVEVGPGRVLMGLIKRIRPEARLVGVGDDAAAAAFANELAVGVLG